MTARNPDRSWEDDAACRGLDPDVFHDDRSEMRAKAICSECPVRLECLERELAQDPIDQHGVFGGLNRFERQTLIYFGQGSHT